MGICQIIISMSDTDKALPFSGGVTLAWCDSLPCSPWHAL